jgi:hypothetical protein
MKKQNKRNIKKNRKKISNRLQSLKSSIKTNMNLHTSKNEKSVSLELKEDQKNVEKYLKYYTNKMTIDEHLNQPLWFQFYSVDLDYNYTVKYDNSIGFQFKDRLICSEEEILNYPNGFPPILYKLLEEVKKQDLGRGKPVGKLIDLCDIYFTLCVKHEIIPKLKESFEHNPLEMLPTVEMYQNIESGTGDFFIEV